MRRRLILCHPVFFLFLAMLMIPGCAGKVVLVPPEPSAEDTATPGVTPPASEPAHPEPAKPEPAQPEPAQPEPAQPEQTQPGQTQPGQAQPGQTLPGPPPATAVETPGQPAASLPPLQPKLGPAASLYHQSEQHLKEGRIDQAEMALERALRIEPRNPYYWHVMAEIRLRQGKKREAIQCCLKSNSLSGNAPLVRRNNALINRAQAGDTADADFR